MTQFRKTIETYKKGNKIKAFIYYQEDKNAIKKDITFNRFCEFMDNTIGTLQSVDLQGKKEYC